MIFSLACIQPRNKWKIIIPSFKHQQSYNNSALIDSMRAHRARNNKGRTVRELTSRKIDSYSNSHLISSHRDKIARKQASRGLFNSLFKTSDDEFKKIYKEMDRKLYDCEELLDINKSTVLVQNKEISSQNIINEKINDIDFVYLIAENYPTKILKQFIDDQKNKYQQKCASLIISHNNDKLSIVLGVTEDLTSDFDSAKVIQEVSKILGGKGGGGRKDMAQAGGASLDNIDQAIEKIKSNLSF